MTKSGTSRIDTKCAAAVELGRRGGAATSPEKATAARENGKLGGRPRKPQPYCTQPRLAGEGCETCSLVNYGRDCANVTVHRT
jgi:hypothetical protein